MAQWVILTLASAALAGDRVDKTKKQENLARAACLIGDYQKGTRILVDLFIQTGNPVHLFNQGRCYEQNHRWEEAVDRFREYLRKATDLDDGTRAYVDKHLAECESHLEGPASVQPPAPPPAPSPPAVREAEASAVPPVQTSPVPPAVVENSGSTLRIVGVVTAILGVSSLAYGTYQYFRHESLVDDLKKKGEQYSDKQYSDKQSQINSAKTWSMVGFGVGSTAVIAGATMYLLGKTSSPTSSQTATVTFVPVIGSGQTSLFISGAF